jgi:hypothetical protein
VIYDYAHENKQKWAINVLLARPLSLYWEEADLPFTLRAGSFPQQQQLLLFCLCSMLASPCGWFPHSSEQQKKTFEVCWDVFF